MNFETFVRQPFSVGAVEITEENIAEIASHLGTLKMDGGGNTYIQFDRRVVPNVGKAFVGHVITRMNGSYRCYRPEIFTDQFVKQNANPMTFDIQPPVEDVDISLDENDNEISPTAQNVFDINSGVGADEAPVTGIERPAHTAVLAENVNL